MNFKTRLWNLKVWWRSFIWPRIRGRDKQMKGLLAPIKRVRLSLNDGVMTLQVRTPWTTMDRADRAESARVLGLVREDIRARDRAESAKDLDRALAAVLAERGKS